MELPRSLRFVSYAVNGRGLGHLVRQVAIHRWLRRYGAFAGVRTEHWFLTTSEADTLLHHEGFAGFKLPSKSVVEPAGIDKASYLGLAKQWVWHSVGLLRPDLFVVDTFPEGSFGELPGVLDLCRHSALVLRPVKEGFARLGGFRAALPLYERILVPTSDVLVDGDDEEARAFGEIASCAGARARRVGPISLVEGFGAASREEARRALGVPEGATALLVTGGGGGDDDVDMLFQRVLEAVSGRDDVHLVLAAGPLFRGTPRGGVGITWWTSHGLSRLLPGIDAAVSATGFNATHELLLAGVPTLFVPQHKIADDQHARAERLARAGLCLVGSLSDVAALEQGITGLLDEERRASLRARVAAAGLRNHAGEAAARLLELALPRSLVRHAVEELSEVSLSRASGLGAGLPEVVDLAVALSPRDAQDRGSLELEPALDLLERTRDLGAFAPELGRAARALLGKRRGRDVEAEEVVDAIAALLEHPACFGQVSGLAALLEALPVAKDLALGEVVAAARMMLDDALRAGRPISGGFAA